VAERWVADWNKHPRPFVWHKTAEQIFGNLAGHLNRMPDSGHQLLSLEEWIDKFERPHHKHLRETWPLTEPGTASTISTAIRRNRRDENAVRRRGLLDWHPLCASVGNANGDNALLSDYRLPRRRCGRLAQSANGFDLKHA